MEFRNNNIELSQLPAMESVAWNQLESNYLKIMYFNTIFLWILPIIWLILSYFFQFWEGAAWSWAVTAFLIILPVLTTLLVKPSFQVKAYALRTHDILYQSGLITRSQTVIPFDRVQHCEIGRGVMSRWLGLSELNIFTAGGSASDLSIPGLSEARAAELCQYILLKIEAADEEE